MKVALNSVGLGGAVVVAPLVVLQLLIQLFLQGWRTANGPDVTLDILRRGLDLVQILDTGFHRHRDAVRTHQRCWKICQSGRKVTFYSTLHLTLVEKGILTGFIRMNTFVKVCYAAARY